MEILQSSIKTLVVRNDKIGDFVLIFPALALLKSSMPDVYITVLVPQYTADLAKICPWIDDIIIDPGAEATFSEQYQLFKELRGKKFNAIITLYSTSRIGFLSFLANFLRFFLLGFHPLYCVLLSKAALSSPFETCFLSYYLRPLLRILLI